MHAMESAAGCLPGDQHDDTDMWSVLLLLSYFSPQYGQTALHWASRHGHPEVVQTLVQSHADVNVKDNVSIESPH
jgi:hypothetical protein